MPDDTTINNPQPPMKGTRMQVVILTHAEAADAHVMTELRKFLDAGATHIVSHQIAHEDRPDTGAPEADPIKPVAFVPPVPAAPAAPDLASVFGGAAAPAPLPVPSTAVAAPLPTAPVVPPVSSPAPTTAVVPPAPNPAPVVPAPSAPVPPANPAGVVVDAAGLPWDGRIHATAKEGGGTKTADGIWRKKRGVNDPAFIAKVEAELRAAVNAGPAPIPAPVAAPAQAPVIPPPPAVLAPAVGESTFAAVAAQAAAAAVPPVPVAPVAATGPTFQSLMVKIAPHMASGRLTPAKQAEVLAAFGLTSIAGLMQRPDLVASVDQTFDAVLA